MNGYSEWLAELVMLNQQLQKLAQQQEWQVLESSVTDYLLLAANPPSAQPPNGSKVRQAINS